MKQIIEVHGGTISVQSEHGSGSTFTFTVPANAPAEGGETTSKEAVPDAIGALQGLKGL